MRIVGGPFVYCTLSQGVCSLCPENAQRQMDDQQESEAESAQNIVRKCFQ